MEIHDLPVLAEVEELEALDFVFEAHIRDRDVLITRYRGTIVRPMEGGQYQLIGWQKSIYHFGGLNREVPIGVVMTTDSDGVIQDFRFDGRCEGSQGKNCDFSILHDRISEELIGKTVPDIERLYITAGDVQCLHVFEILCSIASFYGLLKSRGLAEGQEQELATIIPTESGLICRDRHELLGGFNETEMLLTHREPHRLNERNLCSYVNCDVHVRRHNEGNVTESLYAENFEGVYAQLNRLFSKCLRQEKRYFGLFGKVRYSMYPSLAGLFLLTFSHEGMEGSVDRALKIEKILHFIQAGEGRTPCLGFDGDLGIAKKILFAGNN